MIFLPPSAEILVPPSTASNDLIVTPGGIAIVPIHGTLATRTRSWLSWLLSAMLMADDHLRQKAARRLNLEAVSERRQTGFPSSTSRFLHHIIKQLASKKRTLRANRMVFWTGVMHGD
ncbi:MAG: hypothetical protein HQL97_07480 [Magnetococcales bacterium]|nr:hypothetical protein [Magnetococcales bacterium]